MPQNTSGYQRTTSGSEMFLLPCMFGGPNACRQAYGKHFHPMSPLTGLHGMQV